MYIKKKTLVNYQLFATSFLKGMYHKKEPSDVIALVAVYQVVFV